MFSNIIAMHDHSFLFVYPLLLESYLHMHQNLHGKLIASATIQTQKSKRNGVALTYSFRRGSRGVLRQDALKHMRQYPSHLDFLYLLHPSTLHPRPGGGMAW